MRKLIPVAVLVLLLAGTAWAQDPVRADVFLGYSYARADLLVQNENAHGWNASVAGYPHKNLGLEADFSGHYGRINGVEGLGFQNNLFLFGPKVATGRRVRPFAHGLFGLANTKVPGASSNDFALAFGGGLDVGGKRVAARLGQLDYVLVREPFGTSSNSDNLRFSTGLVFRW